MFQTLFDRFCQWLDETRRDSTSILHRIPLPHRPSQLQLPTADGSSTSSRCRRRSSSLLSPDDVRHQQHRHRQHHRHHHSRRRHHLRRRRSSSDGSGNSRGSGHQRQCVGGCSGSSSRNSSSSELRLLQRGCESGTTSDGWTSGSGFHGSVAMRGRGGGGGGGGECVESPSWATSAASTCSSMATFSSTSTALSDCSPTTTDDRLPVSSALTGHDRSAIDRDSSDNRQQGDNAGNYG